MTSSRRRHLVYVLYNVFMCQCLCHLAATADSSETTISWKGLESGLFTPLDDGCIKAFYPVGPDKKGSAKSKLECAIKCLSDPACYSVNIVNEIVDPTSVFCLYFNTAAESCEDVFHSQSWLYLRLTNYQGERRNEEKTEENAGCGNGDTCDANKCAPWEWKYEIIDKNEMGDKWCFLQALKRGALVRVELKLPDEQYHSLTPVSYSIHSSENTDTAQFEFAPRYYKEYNGERQDYITYKDYIGLSTDGKYSIMTYSMANDLVRRHFEDNLTAKFAVRRINCNTDDTPVYTTKSNEEGNAGNVYNLLAQGKKASVFTVHLKHGLDTTVIQDRWSQLDEAESSIGIIKYIGDVFSTEFEYPQVADPLYRHYKIVTTDGYVQDVKEKSKNDELETTISNNMEQVWYADSCWEKANIVYSDGREHTSLNSTYLIDKILTGSRVRVQYYKKGLWTSKSVGRVVCMLKECKAFLDDHPVLQREEPFIFDFSLTSYSNLVVSELSGVSIKSYSSNKSAFREDVLELVNWYVDSMSYKPIFIVSNRGNILLESISNLVGSGVDVQMVVIIDDIKISLEIEEVTYWTTQSGSDGAEFITSTCIADIVHNDGCGTSPVLRSRFTLKTDPVSFKVDSWTADWQKHCRMNQDMNYDLITVFASIFSA